MTFWAVDPPADPYFDDRLDCWIVSRYRDCAAALRDPRLVPALARSRAPAAAPHAAAHADFRTKALRVLAPAEVAPWEPRMVLAADRLVSALPWDEPVDLVSSYARPLALEVAGIAMGVSAEDASRMDEFAGDIFDSACEPYDDGLALRAQQAIREMAAFFRGKPAWSVQMFAALTRTLPALLGNAWLALMESAVEVVDYAQAVDELMRYAGPAKAQFRQAVADVVIGTSAIAAQQRVILRLDIANRDPDEFPDPHTLRFDRAAVHLAFGTGLHACVGSAPIRSAVAIATRGLFKKFRCTYVEAVPADRFAIRYLSSLTVTVRPRAEGA